MSEREIPQIYLVTPQAFELTRLTASIKDVLDTLEIACLRLQMASTDEDEIARTADALRAIAHERDIPLILSSHVQLVERLGLDGVHLTDGPRSVRATRKALGADPVVGSFCGPSRHDAMNAGEAGADYVAMGPIGASALGDGTTAQADDFEWWSQMIELPIVAEGNITQSDVEALAEITDFFAIGDEIWRSENPSQSLKELLAPLG